MSEYETIRRWGQHLGYFRVYVEAQVRKAHEEKAPPNSIYKSKGQWVTAEYIVDPVLRAKIMGSVDAS